MDYIQITKSWIDQFVIKHNLCPFAAFPFRNKKIRYQLEETEDVEKLVMTLINELNYIKNKSGQELETSLIIHPKVLNEFLDYNDFLYAANELLKEMNLDGEIQIASFHPNYQFAGEAEDAPSNFVTRSPFPMLHLLREDSVAKAIQSHPNTEQIPFENIDKMNEIGFDQLNSFLRNLFKQNSNLEK